MGTNSTRLLVAEVVDGRVREIERQSTVTRLGRGVDTSGQLAAEAIEDVCEAVAGYVEIYERHGVDRVRAIATSAVRDARNGDMFRAELRERFALDARILDGAEEARLTYLGACAERPPTPKTLVIDIGGGSTELVIGDGPDVGFYASLQVGTVRHTERHITHDPAEASELEALAGDVQVLIDRLARGRGARPGEPRDRRRRHADVARRDRAGARPLRPRARPRLRALPRVDPADVLAPRLDDRSSSAFRSSASTRAARPRSSPAS